MATQDENERDASASETAPGVSYLRKLWKISSSKRDHVEAPQDAVSTNIYNVPALKRRLPPR